MKYNFINKGKKLSADDIKGQMNFDNMAKGASALAGAKVGASLLKSSVFASKGFLIGASTVIIASAVLIVANSGLLDENKSVMTDPEVAPTESLLPFGTDTLKSTSTTFKVPSSDPQVAIVDETKTVESNSDSASTKAVNDASERVMIIDSIRHVDVTTQARPLPDLETFTNYIDQELKYPIDPITVSVNEGDNDLVQQEGYVELFWTVNKQGRAENFKIMKSMGKSFDNEAIRVLKGYQNWEPASFNGEAVDSNLRMKVHFAVK